MNWRAWIAVPLASWLTASPCAADESRWDFTVMLDGEPIGEHRFTVQTAGGERRVQSQADFQVRFLGIVAYRYRHRAMETWRGDCLAEVQARTDDDGSVTQVRAQARTPGLGVVADDPALMPLDGCVLSFAYWNRAMRRQTRLLNVQTGQAENVQVRRLDTGLIEVRGRSVSAARWRIFGLAQPIDLWYAEAGDEWVGLDSIVRGGRRLSYRLR